MPIAGPNIYVMMMIQLEHDLTNKLNRVMDNKMKLSQKGIFISDQKANVMNMQIDVQKDSKQHKQCDTELQRLEALQKKLEQQEKVLDQQKHKYETMLQSVQNWKQSEEKILQNGIKQGFQIKA